MDDVVETRSSLRGSRDSLARPDGWWALHPGVKRQPPTLRPPPINCSVLASLCDKNVKIDGAAALGQQLDGRQRGRSLAWSFVAREPGRRRLPPPPPRRLSQTKETTHWGQNSFSVICALIGRRAKKEASLRCMSHDWIHECRSGKLLPLPSHASLPALRSAIRKS